MPLPATGAKTARSLPQETGSLPEPAKAPVTRKFPLPELPGNEPLPAQAVQPKQLPKPPAQAVETSEPRLTLSGIAWNKDSAERLAIINGQPASTGSHIGGAVVEEILPDRVRLSSKGRVFELSIGRSGN
jgi:general secretion pathway protein B